MLKSKMLLGFNRKKKLRIRLLGDPSLSAKAKPVDSVDDEIRELSRQMLDCMYAHDGVGLAAPQVGIPYQIVALHVDPEVDESGHPLHSLSPGEAELLSRMPLTLINPEIVSSSAVSSVMEEGCLSVPKIYAPVERPVSVLLKSRLLDGSTIHLECGGFLARAIQHELDHLQGIVYVQKVKSPYFEEILPHLEKIVRKSGNGKNFKIKRLV